MSAPLRLLIAAYALWGGEGLVSVPLGDSVAADADANGAGGRALGAIHYPRLYEVVARLKALANEAPDLVEVWSAQDKYGTPSPGNCRKSATAGDVEPCKHWFVTITDRPSAALEPWASQSPSSSERPQVFFSGNLHGDEYVGPVTLITLAELLVHGATPTHADYNPLLARLVLTRKTVILVVSNPQAYDAVEPRREEITNNGSHDPNRDFPFHQLPAKCMLTTVARAVNSAWREHIFQLAVTFHGGMQAITYEWGAPNHIAHNSESPDDAAQEAMGGVLRDIAGVFNEGAYPVDRINNLVYPVDGGMEDWAYGGAWGPIGAHDRGAGARMPPTLLLSLARPQPPPQARGTPTPLRRASPPRTVVSQSQRRCTTPPSSVASTFSLRLRRPRPPQRAHSALTSSRLCFSWTWRATATCRATCACASPSWTLCSPTYISRPCTRCQVQLRRRGITRPPVRSKAPPRASRPRLLSAAAGPLVTPLRLRWPCAARPCARSTTRGWTCPLGPGGRCRCGALLGWGGTWEGA